MIARSAFFSVLVVGLIFIFSFIPRLIIQDDFQEVIKEKLKNFNRQVPQEKLYLQLDKPFYKPGEDIWLYAFLVNGTDHKPSNVSQVIYVELINPKGNVEYTLQLPVLHKGGSKGDFHLGENAAGGMYKIRAYTKWMKNFGEDQYFEKTIQVQKVSTPKLLLKLDFEKEAYGPSDKVVGKFEAKDLQNAPLSFKELDFTVHLQGKIYKELKGRTDGKGKADLEFVLPADLESNDGLLNIIVQHDGKKEAISRSIPIILNKIDLQFFPEGGNLVENVPGKIAFKALNEFGKPADVAGEVLDETDKVVQSFESYHQGMGAFSFTANAGEKYRVRITNPRNIRQQYDIPSAAPKGYTLSVEKVGNDKIELKFHVPIAKEVYLVGQFRGEIYYSQRIMAKEGFNQELIDVKNFPIGIAQFTLFDYNHLPKCERLIFLNQEKNLKVQISSNKKKYRPGEKVELTIQTFDQDDIPVSASLALSVVNDQLLTFADDKQDNIVSYLLMSSDLKGKIEEPSFYFKKEEPKAAFALDYLLMTQGWRRFTWEEVLHDTPQITILPEKFGMLSGQVIHNSTQKPEKAKVTLFEISHGRRSVQVETREDGTFDFLNLDPRFPVQLFVEGQSKNRNNLRLLLNQEQYNLIESPSIERKDVSSPSCMWAWPDAVVYEVPDEEEIVENVEITFTADNPENIEYSNAPMVTMTEDVKSLSEVVVVGYGTTSRSDITGAVEHISAESLTGNLPRMSVEQALQGRVSGLHISQKSGEAKYVQVRGLNHLAFQGDPLYVLDGFPLSGNLNENFSITGNISAEDIHSIVVMKSPEATAVYGSSASGGAIVITTRRESSWNDFTLSIKKKGISNVYLPARKFTPVREFYTPEVKVKDSEADRTDFRSTVYWDPAVKTDRKGEAKISFYNTDEISAFKVIAEGISSSGLPGREEYEYFTSLPLTFDAKVPAYMTFEDVVHVPVFLKNNTDTVLQGNLQLDIPACLSIEPFSNTVSLKPEESVVLYITAKVLSKAGNHNLKISFTGNSYHDALSLPIEVQAKGFPTEASFSGNDLSKAFSFNISEPMPGSLKASFKAYPDVIEDLMAGIESIIREPYGCFEQVSSSTYPNVLALQYLRETKTLNKEVEEKALKYIDSGYKKLAAYETKHHGFEWYGATPPHEGLSAFGLMEFLEMQQVYKGVSEDMINRTKNWLLSRKEGDGNFKQNRGKYGFSAASKNVNNAYLVYALSEAGIKDLKKEYELAYQEALSSEDAYRMALLKLASFNLNETTNAKTLKSALIKQIQRNSLGNLNAEHSIVISYGKSLQVETASLIFLAMLREQEPDIVHLQQLLDYIISSRSHGGFGSTQATILALKAITEYAKFSQKTADGGKISVFHNNKLIDSKVYAKNTRGDIVMDGIEHYMQEGSQTFKVIFDDTKEALPYSMNVSWASYKPNSHNECKVKLQTLLSDKETQTGKTVRLTTILTNTTHSGLPMTVALIGIPSGLSLQPWQLKELQEKGKFDYYEVLKNYVVFYYRELGPGAIHQIDLDLKAEVPGTYQGPASSAYLYYTNEFKDWTGGLNVEVLR